MSERSEIPSSQMAVINGIDSNVSDIKSNYVTTTALTNALSNIGGSEVITITHSNGTGSAHVEVKSGDTVLNANVASGGTVSVPFGIEYTIYAYDSNGLVVDRVTKIAARYSSSYSFDLTVTGVDLGLPSGKIWAQKNIGASTKYNAGTFFYWADIRNDISSFTSSRSTDFSYRIDGYSFESGDYRYDAARRWMGDTWRVPTYIEYKELIDNCTATWSSATGAMGVTFTGPSGKTLFIPVSGYKNESSYVTNVSTSCCCWTSSPYESTRANSTSTSYAWAF